MTRERDSRDEKSSTEPRPRRRPWRAPKLTEYGPVAKLTQTGLGSISDGGMGSMMSQRTCL